MIVNKKVKLIKNEKKYEIELSFKEIDYQTTKDMIIKNHYSKKWNTAFGKINIGVFNNDELLGVASFGNLMNPKSYKKFNDEFTKDSVIELNRLWVDDTLGKNVETVLLSVSFKMIKSLYPNVKIIQSFADGRLGCGTIYKASNFKYYGYTESIFYENIETGITYHDVPFHNTKRPDGMIKLNTMWVEGKLKAFKVKTYRYIYPLYKNQKIKLKEKEYPKYDIGLEYLDDIGDKSKVITRAYVLSLLLNYDEKVILQEWVDKHATQEDLDIAFENDSIKLVSEERNKTKEYLDLYNSKNDLIGKKQIIKESNKQMSIFDLLSV